LWDTVSEPLRAHLKLPRDLVATYRDAALKRVGLASVPGDRAVAVLSAFDKRRLQVARAIVSAPLLAVIDEPLRGLDAFAQSVMRDLLKNFRSQEGPAFLVVTSDFAVAQALCEDALVVARGKVIERGAISDLVKAPKEPQTKALIDASLGRLPSDAPQV
jgi:peptide/nickel transport system ATP-binding protein